MTNLLIFPAIAGDVHKMRQVLGLGIGRLDIVGLQTALYISAQRGNVELIELLVEHGASLDKHIAMAAHSEFGGQTALHVALKANSSRAIGTLRTYACCGC